MSIGYLLLGGLLLVLVIGVVAVYLEIKRDQ